MNHLIRPVEETDLEPLCRLYEAFFTEDAIETPSDDIRRNLLFMMKDSRAAIWVAEDEKNEILGFSSASITYGVEFGCAAEIEDLYVRPQDRGKGLSKSLLNCAMQWAEGTGAQEIILVITPESEADQGLTAFYERFGFRNSHRTVMSHPVDRKP